MEADVEVKAKMSNFVVTIFEWMPEKTERNHTQFFIYKTLELSCTFSRT